MDEKELAVRLYKAWYGIEEFNGEAAKLKPHWLRVAAEAAARRIEALEAENRRMREALRLIASCERRAEGDVVDIARATLEGEKP